MNDFVDFMSYLVDKTNMEVVNKIQNDVSKNYLKTLFKQTNGDFFNDLINKKTLKDYLTQEMHLTEQDLQANLWNLDNIYHNLINIQFHDNNQYRIRKYNDKYIFCHNKENDNLNYVYDNVIQKLVIKIKLHFEVDKLPQFTYNIEDFDNFLLENYLSLSDTLLKKYFRLFPMKILNRKNYEDNIFNYAIGFVNIDDKILKFDCNFDNPISISKNKTETKPVVPDDNENDNKIDSIKQLQRIVKTKAKLEEINEKLETYMLQIIQSGKTEIYDNPEFNKYWNILSI